MPLVSAHVFCSHIGHTGKTTMTFQMANYFAARHPELKVLVMDFTEEGDLTKRLLGGVDNAREKMYTLFGGVFQLVQDAHEKASRNALTSWIRGSDVDITQHAIHLKEHNSNVPDNIYLVSSGSSPWEEDALPPAARKAVAQKIRTSLEASRDTWKLFCDTDGDRRPSPFTMLAYSLAELAIVPLHCSKSDLDRTETMFGMMNEMRKSGEISTQILMIIWNFVKSQKNDPCEHEGLSLPFTPAKVNLEIMSACNKRIAAIARDPEFAGLFLRGSAATSELDFLRNSICAVRQFADNVQRPAEELGMPFVTMVDSLRSSGKKQIAFNCTGVKYQADGDTIEAADLALQELTTKFEAMALDTRA